MPTLEALRENVKVIIQDDSFTDDQIDALINRGLRYVAGKVLLAALESSGVASTELDTYSVAIPVGWNFARNLFSAETVNGDIQILNSIEELQEVYPNFKTELQTGEPEFILVSNGQLIYYPIPTTVTELTCGFYTKPRTLTRLLTPDELPEHLQEDILENYACMRCFAKIEDGMDGAKVDTLYYERLFKEALQELEDDTETGQSRAKIRRRSDWF